MLYVYSREKPGRTVRHVSDQGPRRVQLLAVQQAAAGQVRGQGPPSLSIFQPTAATIVICVERLLTRAKLSPPTSPIVRK